MPPEDRAHLANRLEQAEFNEGNNLGIDFQIYRRANPMKRFLLTNVPIMALVAGQFCLYGARSVDDVYSFQYNNKPASVRHENIRFGLDNYYILIDGKDRIAGTLVSDEGKEIKAGRGFYNVRDAGNKK